MQYNYDYFISYAHKDNKLPDGKPGFVNEFVEKLRNGSEEHKRIFGGEIRAFFDETEIHDMSDWDNRIRSSLASSRFLIVLLSPNYFKSEYCAREFDWWMKHEMHRCTLGEGTAPMIISNVGVFDPAITPAPDIPEKIQIRFPNWLSQIQAYQSRNFDMHDFLIARIDNVLKTLRDEVKDKVRHQEIVDSLPYDTYLGYNENFVGRRENLLSLRKYMTQKSGRVISSLTGLGGFGKTELALTYGHAFGWDYRLGRFFKSCENCNSIYDAFLSCGIQAKYGWKLKGTDEEQLLFIFNHLKVERDKIIRQNTEAGDLKTEGAHLLLILDNVNNLDLISQLVKLNLPDFIHIVITTRENTSAFANIYTESVERLSEDESVELLNALRSFDNRAEAEAARKIAKLLAGFTLVVELTGAFLAKNQKNKFVTYQRQFELFVKNHGETFQKMADKIGNLTRHAAETVTAVMESTLSALSGNARKALEFASLMDPDAVAAGWLPELCDLNEEDGVEILNELTGYSLLTQLENEPNIARIHRLVAETVKQEIQEDVFTDIVYKIWVKCDTLLEKDETFWCSTENSWNITSVFKFFLMVARYWTVETSEEKIDWNLTKMLEKSGILLNSLGKINEARKVFMRLYEISKARVKSFPSNIDAKWTLGASYNNLGNMDFSIGNTDSAREWYKKGLEIALKLAISMPENVSVQQDLSTSFISLGDLEGRARNTDLAREWYTKALGIYQQLSNNMSDDIEILHNFSALYERLGVLEKDAGNLTTARIWYKKALINIQKLADIIPDDILVLRGLYHIYEDLGDLEEELGNTDSVWMWYKQALEIAQQLFNVMPENVQAKCDLASLFERFGSLEKDAGNINAAHEWYMKTLEISQQLINKIPGDVEILRNMSIIYERFGDLEKDVENISVAQDWYEKALKILNQLVNQIEENAEVQEDFVRVLKKLALIQK